MEIHSCLQECEVLALGKWEHYFGTEADIDT